MLLPRATKGIYQVGLRRSCLHLQRTGMRVPSGWKPEVAQKLWRTAYAKRAFGAGVVASVGLGISAFTGPKVLCEAPPSSAGSPGPGGTAGYPPHPQSSVSAYELSFGAVTGVCAGVFVKKGAKAVAWLLGGVFVLLQYLGSKSIVRVDWARVSSRFETLFHTRDAAGDLRPPSVVSLWRWLIDFLTADFQPRASFIAGFALGIRIG